MGINRSTQSGRTMEKELDKDRVRWGVIEIRRKMKRI